jgi:alcohol dehydrogenase class IV
MLDFIFSPLPGRVVFGRGRLDGLRSEAERLRLSRVVVFCTPGKAALAEQVTRLLGPLASGVHAQAVMHVPEAVAAAAVDYVRIRQADGIVAFGGGSTIGLAKAVALQTGLPVIAVPTTYAGSEMTPIWGITRQDVKTTGRDLRVLPRTVIYDSNLTLSLPPEISVTSGINAMAHCVEGLYAEDANPLTSLMAEEGIRAFAHSLPQIVADPLDAEARDRALYGAWLGGSVLGAVGMALHHKLCHTLGGGFNLPHADVHTVMLPQVTAFNASAAPQAMERIAAALGTPDAASGLFDLIVALGAPHALRDIGMRARDLDKAAELATRNPYYNPRGITHDNIRQLLQLAYEGKRPT